MFGIIWNIQNLKFTRKNTPMLKMVQHVEKPILGIDVGTSNTCAAVWVNGHAEIVVDDMGNSAVPSYVGFTSMERLIGEAAKACQVAMNPRNTIYDVKKLIGRRFEDSSGEIKEWPFTVVQWEGQPHYKIEVGGSGRLNESRFTPQAIASMIIGKMKEMAESYLGQSITEAVFTVPIYFEEAQRKAVREAGSMAGLNVLGLVDEATATALTYARGKMFKGKRNILIFDWGGGTLSVHVLVVTMDKDGTHVEVKATESDIKFGSSELEGRMVNYFCQEFRLAYRQDIRANLRAMTRLRIACERAKITLSSGSESEVAPIRLENLHNGVDFYTKISRNKFEELCRDIFEIRPAQLIHKVLENAKLERNQIHDVIMVGGSSVIPKVKEVISNIFFDKVLNTSLHPKESVAYGAALHGSILAEEIYDRPGASCSSFGCSRMLIDQV